MYFLRLLLRFSNNIVTLRHREAFLEQSGMSYASWHPKVHNGKFSPLQIKLLESIAGQTF